MRCRGVVVLDGPRPPSRAACACSSTPAAANVESAGGDGGQKRCGQRRAKRSGVRGRRATAPMWGSAVVRGEQPAQLLLEQAGALSSLLGLHFVRAP